MTFNLLNSWLKIKSFCQTVNLDFDLDLLSVHNYFQFSSSESDDKKNEQRRILNYFIRENKLANKLNNNTATLNIHKLNLYFNSINCYLYLLLQLLSPHFLWGRMHYSKVRDLRDAPITRP